MKVLRASLPLAVVVTGAATETRLLRGTPEKYLPVGQGAYVSGEAVAQRTQDLRKGCEDSKIYKSPNWQDCFTKGGDYIDATEHDGPAPKSSLLQEAPEKYLPIGQGAYVSGEAVAQRTKDLRKGCEDSKVYKSPNWQACFTKGGDYIDATEHSGPAPKSSLLQEAPEKYLPIGQGAYVSGEAVAQRTKDLRKGCEDSKIYKSPNWQDCFTNGGDYIDATEHSGPAPKSSLLQEAPEKYLPIGQGAYVSSEAVAQRTKDMRKGCEDSKIYKSPKWQDCFTKGGDYIDATEHSGLAPKASLLQEAPEKYLPIGQGAYVSGEAVAQRTKDLRKGCEDSKIYKSPNWQDCFEKSGDYIDHINVGATVAVSHGR